MLQVKEKRKMGLVADITRDSVEAATEDATKAATRSVASDATRDFTKDDSSIVGALPSKGELPDELPFESEIPKEGTKGIPGGRNEPDSIEEPRGKGDEGSEESEGGAKGEDSKDKEEKKNEDPSGKQKSKICMRNKALCAAGGALGLFVATQFAGNTVEQQNCIAKCLPSNFDQTAGPTRTIVLPKDADKLTPQTSTDKKQPLCEKADFVTPGCKKFCDNKCEALFPTSPSQIIKKDVENFLSYLWNKILPGKWLKIGFCIFLGLIVLKVMWQIMQLFKGGQKVKIEQ